MSQENLSWQVISGPETLLFSSMNAALSYANGRCSGSMVKQIDSDERTIRLVASSGQQWLPPSESESNDALQGSF
jgi:hypothetical protein